MNENYKLNLDLSDHSFSTGSRPHYGFLRNAAWKRSKVKHIQQVFLSYTSMNLFTILCTADAERAYAMRNIFF